MGRVVLGVSTALAILLAAGFVAETFDTRPTTVAYSPQASPIETPKIGACVSPGTDKPGSYSEAASFLIKNTSNKPVRILALRPTPLLSLAAAHVTLFADADPNEKRDWQVRVAMAVPDDTITASAPIADDGSTVIAGNAFATVITNMTLGPDSSAGQVGEFELTTRGSGERSRTQTIHTSLGLGRSSDACSGLRY